MDASQLQRLDAKILLGIVNEKLRLECGSLNELLAYYDVSEMALGERMATIGYRYDPLCNQFRHQEAENVF
ncbi:protein of unknown function [Aeromonas sp. RU39B]|uniref:DUF4250 domain-containing protein n=1 Tax=Aeromonas sp. RU39B TaxID=1907416 RepID=UPI0009567A29|nr:DUF4250 domain-containing protein [Aeromonas sp. RU39B]SIQ26027.1 protein of unknown function [Aeromonas sp. RU39B]